MKICIYGAGAVGGLMAGWLARAGHAVSVVARGAHLTAIREKGLRIRSEGKEQRVPGAGRQRPGEARARRTA